MVTFQNFMDNNIGYIIALVALFISLLTLFTFLGIDFNYHGRDHVEKVVTVEGMMTPLDENEESTVPQSATVITKTPNNPKPVQLQDSSSMTGSSVSVSTSSRQADELREKKDKERRILSMLKSADSSFTQSLADKKGTNSHCHPRFSTIEETEQHCNRMKNNKTSCDVHNCCVWLVHDKGPQCVAGGPQGPVYHTKNKNPVDKSQYYHNGNCHGEGC